MGCAPARHRKIIEVLYALLVVRNESCPPLPSSLISSLSCTPAQQRLQAAAFLHDAGNPDRPFDAVVIGEYERFSGRQAQLIIPQL
jgi:hypothetical protein